MTATLRALCLTRYGRLGASSRLRSLQYLPAMRDHDIDVVVSPLFDDIYVKRLYEGNTAWGTVVKGYLNRLTSLVAARRYDVVWLEKEALPWIPSALELTLLGSGTPLVVDYDDAVFHYYDNHPSSLVRSLLERKIDRVMNRAQIVVVGNAYLGARAVAAGASRVEQVPTVIDLARYDVEHQCQNRPPTIGWIGNPGTAPFLRLIAEPLGDVLQRFEARAVAVGLTQPPLPSVPIEPRRWTEETEVGEIRQFDIGVMPLIDGPFERGKCGYKLVQYMACGKPVIASPVGVNCEIVEHGVNGYLASTPEEWRDALSRLLADRGLRQRMGEAGRRLVESKYSLQVTAPRLAGLLRTAAKTHETPRATGLNQ
jgi:glycosyltransferase involved in cell wall biosynthesis